MDSQNSKDFALISEPNGAKNAPPSAPIAALTANASDLYRLTLMPIDAAACSSSRMATHALPTRECCSR